MSDRHEVVVAGPSSHLTVPGLVVTEIVNALAANRPVTRVEVDLGVDYETGLHRAPSLAAAHSQARITGVTHRVAPVAARPRGQALRQWISKEVEVAVAFAWPSLDNSWIRQLVTAAHRVGAAAVVVCVSLPRSSRGRLASLVDQVRDADLVLVGSPIDAQELRGHLGPGGPAVEYHGALALHGRSGRRSIYEISAFLPRDNATVLSTLLAAFDAIPEAWIDRYQLNVIMRYEGEEVPSLVERSYHREFVRLVDRDLTSEQVSELAEMSSAVIVADPAVDSRAFITAMHHGIATVVLAESNPPRVGQRYVGGLLADVNRPVSVHVALNHALRLAELQFPTPESWDDLAARLTTSTRRSRTGDFALQVVPPAP